MGKIRISRKYQITIPKDVRDKIKLKAGEIVEVEAVDNSTIIVKRKTVRDPLNYLIGKKPAFKKSIPMEEVESAAEEALH